MRLSFLALALVACAHVPRSTAWTVEGDGPREEALAMVAAARRVYPNLGGGVVHFVPGDAYVACYGPKPPAERGVVTGCLVKDGVVVAWPVPWAGGLEASALPHELAHRAGAATEDQADAGALLVVLEYRRR